MTFLGIEDDLFGWLMAFAVLYLFYLAIRRHKNKEARHEKRVLLSQVKARSPPSSEVPGADVVPCPDHPLEKVVMTESDGVVVPCPKCR